MKEKEIKAIVCTECSEKWMKDKEYCPDCVAIKNIVQKLSDLSKQTLSANNEKWIKLIEVLYRDFFNMTGKELEAKYGMKFNIWDKDNYIENFKAIILSQMKEGE